MEKPRVDPITLEIIKNALQSVAEEMGATLIRAAYSTNIKDRRDCSCAIYDRRGELVAQAEHIPLHLGLMANVVKKVFAKYTMELRSGDAIIHNDPYTGGSHIPDVMIFFPVFSEGRLIAIVGNLAHHVDMGGMVPGSCPPLATEIYQEGLRIPPLKLYENGKLNQTLLDIIKTNIRTPHITEKDILAQTAANMVGQKRMSELVIKYGTERTLNYMDAILDYSERMMRAKIRELPDARVDFEDFIEGDGHNDKPIRIYASVEIKGDEVHVDFTGSSSQVKGSINAVESVTLASVYYVLKSVLDPEIPSNSGAYRPIHVTAPKGTIVNAEFPAANSNMNPITSQRIVDVLMGAFFKIIPKRVPAACAGTMNGLMIGGIDPGTKQYYAYVETYGGGQGAMYNQDGMDGVQTNMTNTRNAPAEVIEVSYPFRVERYGLVRDSAGAGMYRGGLGITREITILDHTATVSVNSDRVLMSPWGLDGGGPGGKGEWLIVKADGRVMRLPSKGTFEAEPGDKIVVRTQGGGGYGDPRERDLEKIHRDVRENVISREQAKKVYGVFIEKDRMKKEG